MLSSVAASSRGRILSAAAARSASASCAGSCSQVPISVASGGVRWHSSNETNAGKTKASKCPITGTAGRDHSTLTASIENDATDTTSSNHPSLQKVPSMPIFGSFFSAVPLIGEKLSEYYGVPILKADNAYDHYPLMRQKYGDFYQICIPGQGKGPRGETVVLTDPHEMLKVLRNEGSHPRGGVEGLWPFQVRHNICLSFVYCAFTYMFKLAQLCDNFSQNNQTQHHCMLFAQHSNATTIRPGHAAVA